jgi:hypothetical protein
MKDGREGRKPGIPDCLCRKLYYNSRKMAKGITLQIRVTQKQLDWLADRMAEAGGKKVTTFAREFLLQSAPREIREDKGAPLKKDVSA